MSNDFEKMRKQYTEEARELWGDTDAYKESEQRTSGYTSEEWGEMYNGMIAIIEGFAALNKRGVEADHEKPRLQVRKLQQFITEHLYNCTDESLAGLGELYVTDARFKKNIDKHGEGTAEYIAACIRAYFQDQ